MMVLVQVPTPTCPECKTNGVVWVDADELNAAKTKPGLIQDLMPTTPPAIREQLMTGIHGRCWEAMMSEDEAGVD